MLLGPMTPQSAAMSALLITTAIDGLMSLGNWAGSSNDLRRGAHYQALDLDIDPRDPDWLARLTEKLLPID